MINRHSDENFHIVTEGVQIKTLLLHIEEKKYEMKKGDSWCIQKNISHQAEVLKDSIALEIFSPPREDYKKYLDTDSITL